MSRVGFQSLLSWNGLVNLAGVHRGIGFGEVSILVVVERPGQRPTPPAPSRRSPGFNPCCRGTAWSTRRFPAAQSPTGEFQSLLSWNGLVNKLAGVPFGFATSVSILVVVERPGQLVPSITTSLTESRFQSLLSWNGLVNLAADIAGGEFPHVSILVVVERPGQHVAELRCLETIVGFQSLLSWNGLVNLERMGGDRSADGVSILVVVERPGQRRTPGPTRCRSKGVSILVVVERPGQRIYAIHQRLMESGFNPCCRGTAWSTISTAKPTRPAPPVSILVVVERPGQLRRPRRASESCKCFNPCCRGTAWSTRFGGEAGTGASTVSILVVVERPGQLWRQANPSLGITMFQSLLSWNGLVNGEACWLGLDLSDKFQSLLSWNGLVNPVIAAPLPVVGGVSILVVVERPGQHPIYEGYGVDDDDVSILVVVERPGQPRRTSCGQSPTPCFNPCCRGTAWSTVPSRPRAVCTRRSFNPCCRGTAWSTFFRIRSTPTPRSFNPCCRGTAWSTRRDARRQVLGIGFQSLLSWNGLVNGRRRQHRLGGRRVSILVVVERPGQRGGSRRLNRPRESFNPCCRGTAWSTSWRVYRSGSPHRVSILVVVERPGQLVPSITTSLTESRFQSLLSWNGLVDLAEDIAVR